MEIARAPYRTRSCWSVSSRSVTTSRPTTRSAWRSRKRLAQRCSPATEDWHEVRVSTPRSNCWAVLPPGRQSPAPVPGHHPMKRDGTDTWLRQRRHPRRRTRLRRLGRALGAPQRPRAGVAEQQPRPPRRQGHHALVLHHLVSRSCTGAAHRTRSARTRKSMWPRTSAGQRVLLRRQVRAECRALLRERRSSTGWMPHRGAGRRLRSWSAKPR